MKSLGLLRRQVSSVTAWQVSTLAVLALRAGVPLGVAAGRGARALFATGPGVPASALIPATVTLGIVPAVLLAADAVAPGRAIARLRAAEILRAGQGRYAAGARRRGPGRAGRRVSWW